jgi:hypothetical protein
VAQREDLELEGGARSKAGAERREEGEEDCLHGGNKLPHLSGTKHEPPSPAHAPRTSRDDGRVGILGTDRNAAQEPAPACLRARLDHGPNARVGCRSGQAPRRSGRGDRDRVRRRGADPQVGPPGLHLAVA